jgi:RimJ/RimL family protein N-acetyltransferase
VTATDSALLKILNLGPEATSSSQNPVFAIMAFEDDVPVGLCLYFIIYSSWRATGGIWIEDLFVREECRGRGYGIRLMAECAKEVREKYPDGGRLEWSVKVWNEPAIAF